MSPASLRLRNRPLRSTDEATEPRSATVAEPATRTAREVDNKTVKGGCQLHLTASTREPNDRNCLLLNNDECEEQPGSHELGVAA